MKAMKKLMATVAVAGTLFTAMPAPKANAGILLAPAGVGVLFIILGVIHDSLGLLILDGDHGTVVEQVKGKLAQKYNFIDDEQALTDLSELIIEKANASQSEGEVEVKLSEGEILEILEPTGLALVAPEKVEALINDLK